MFFRHIDRIKTAFFSSYALSACGYELIVFIMTLYVYRISNSAFSVGIFTAITFLAKLFSPLLGILTDRYQRSAVFAAAMGIAGLSIFLLAPATRLIWIYLLWFGISVVLMQIANVRTALMAQLMAGNYLLGNSIALILLSFARVVSPVVSGLMAVSHDLKALVYVTGIAYLLAMVIVRTVTLPAQAGFTNKNSTIFRDLREGFVQIRQDANLRFLTVIASLWRLFLGMQLSLFVVYVTSSLAQNDSRYGLFMTTIALGSIFGSLIRPLIIKKFKTTTLPLWGLSVHYCTFAALGLINNYSLALITVFVSYAAFYIALVGLHTLRDKSTPSASRGRVYGFVTMILAVFAIISMLAGGYLANLIGAQRVLLGGGVLALVSLHILNITLKSVRLGRDFRSSGSIEALRQREL